MSKSSEKVAWVAIDTLERFMVDVFKGAGVPEEEARICADVLITADKRGIDSHGISRLKPIYYDRIKAGIQSPITKVEIIKEGPTSAVIDGHNGMGQVIAKKIYGFSYRKGEKNGDGNGSSPEFYSLWDSWILSFNGSRSGNDWNYRY